MDLLLSVTHFKVNSRMPLGWDE